MLKFYEDCANEILFPDDAMIVKGEFNKQWSDKPRTEINIEPIAPTPLHPKVQAILSCFTPKEIEEIYGYHLDFQSEVFQLLLARKLLCTAKYLKNFQKVAKHADLEEVLKREEEFSNKGEP